MNNYYWLGLVGAAVAITQGWMLYKARAYTKLSSAFTILSLVLILQHSLEFVISLYLVNDPAGLTPVMHLFMATLYCMALAMMNVVRFAVNTKLANVAFKLLAVMTIVVLFLHANGLLFGEFALTSYSVISTRGEYGGVWQIYAAMLVTSCAVVLLSGVYSDDKEIQRRSWVTVKALSPILVCVFLVVLLQQLGYEASTAIFLPFASATMLGVLMLEEKSEFMIFEEHLKDQWARLIIKLKVGFYVLFNWHGTDRKELLRNIDTILVSGALNRKDKVTDAARFLNIPRNTLNNIRHKNSS